MQFQLGIRKITGIYQIFIFKYFQAFLIGHNADNHPMDVVMVAFFVQDHGVT